MQHLLKHLFKEEIQLLVAQLQLQSIPPSNNPLNWGIIPLSSPIPPPKHKSHEQRPNNQKTLLRNRSIHPWLIPRRILCPKNSTTINSHPTQRDNTFR